MIIVKLLGGLGNQMFQYAIARSLAQRNSSFLKLDLYGFETYKLRNYDLHCFNIIEQFATIEEITAFKLNSEEKQSFKEKIIKLVGSNPTSRYYNHCKLIKEQTFNFDHTILDQKGHIYIDGYWQTENYFVDIKEIICRDFSFRYEPTPQNQKMLDHIMKVNAVAIHIRRGDYVENAATNGVHGTCSLEYYQHAIALIADAVDNPMFFFFSDDTSWVKQNIPVNHPHKYVDINNDITSYEDLRLMSKCKHHIIANSSFSWWGAWLAEWEGQKVIAPKKWFISDQFNSKDIIPKSWIKI